MASSVCIDIWILCWSSVSAADTKEKGNSNVPTYIIVDNIISSMWWDQFPWPNFYDILQNWWNVGVRKEFLATLLLMKFQNGIHRQLCPVFLKFCHFMIGERFNVFSFQIWTSGNYESEEFINFRFDQHWPFRKSLEGFKNFGRHISIWNYHKIGLQKPRRCFSSLAFS